MSFLDELKKFKAGTLRSTDINVISVDGKRFVETRSQEDGTYYIRDVAGSTGTGFVIDEKPDLQVAHILPFLTIGSQDVAQDLELLKCHQITHILNCTTAVPNIYPNDFQYKQIDILDLPETNIVQYYEECFDFVNTAKKSTNGKIFVHCNAGVSRSATIVIAYLIGNMHMTFEDAFRTVKSVRASINPNAGFLKQLKMYSETIHG